jgi:hypothetical protein
VNIKGLTLDQFQACARKVSAEKYGWNIIVHGDGHDRPRAKDGTPQCTARLATFLSDGQGTRTSANGRHGPYACWHAYRDVLTEVFTRYPDAVIRAGNSWRVTYRGRLPGQLPRNRERQRRLSTSAGHHAGTVPLW